MAEDTPEVAVKKDPFADTDVIYDERDVDDNTPDEALISQLEEVLEAAKAGKVAGGAFSFILDPDDGKGGLHIGGFLGKPDLIAYTADLMGGAMASQPAIAGWFMLGLKNGLVGAQPSPPEGAKVH